MKPIDLTNITSESISSALPHSYSLCTSKQKKISEIQKVSGLSFTPTPQSILDAADLTEPQLTDQQRKLYSDLSIPPETRCQNIAAQVACFKALDCYKKIGLPHGTLPVIEDTSLWLIHSVTPFPGIHIKDYAESPEARDQLLSQVRGLVRDYGEKMREVLVIVTLAVHDPVHGTQFRQGCLSCRCADARRTRSDVEVFGFDDCMEVFVKLKENEEPVWKTLAELGDLKTRISARTSAVINLRESPFVLSV